MTARFLRRGLALIVVLSVFSIATSDLHAQAALDEVIVTAQKREQSLQDVPISVAVVGGEMLQQVGTAGSADLNFIVPSLNVAAALGFLRPYLRGVGTGGNGPGIEAAIATYVDGIYYANTPSTLTTFLDIERIEVLKGPQGTLFGRNATGGLMHVITKMPTQERQLRLELTGGNYETYGANLYASGGLTEEVAASIAVQYADQGEGFGINFATGSEVYKTEDFAVRAKLAAELTSTTSLILNVDSFDRDGSMFAYQPPAGYRPNFMASVPSSPWDVNTNVDPRIATRGHGGSIRLERDFERFKFLSLTGYREGRHHYRFDSDASPVPLIWLNRIQKDRQFTQELQLQSAGDDELHWVGGLFYLDATAKFDPGHVFFDPAGPLAAVPSRDFIGDVGPESLAGFAEASYGFSAATTLTAGLRYTTEENEIDVAEVFFRPTTGAVVSSVRVQDTLKFNELTWRLVLDHQLKDGVMGYASYNRGFKAGAYNLAFPNDIPMQPELIDAYEIGLKMELFDRRTRLNVSAFYYDYDNIHVSYVQAGALGMRNAENAEIYGLDAEVQFIATDDLTLFASFSALQAEFKKFRNGTGYTVNTTGVGFGAGFLEIPGGADFSGNKVANAPELAGNLGIDYTVTSAQGEFTATALYNYNDGYFTESDNLLRQDSYHWLNASLRWMSPQKRFSVTLWGKNLLEEEVVLQLAGGGPNGLSSYRPPRTYGVTFGLDF